MEFKPYEFLANLKYMGVGMLSIFGVIALIILVTVILNKVTSKKNNEQQ